ncbi:AlkA N-terminal domain-containing protein [Salinicola sp. DM10]|uniref:AlkA N-terminal domain-containing protein n=1 Tax=Salinicola sp. DM10 TaxID=2815721 RepID=UPI001A8D0842|nr:AlkA N-terminal domain-containing protein [Salinicola sp. DM10]MCE3025555.1 helix-turn-helix domain-containing protein [Salinicola sp. DM10]
MHHASPLDVTDASTSLPDAARLDASPPQTSELEAPFSLAPEQCRRARLARDARFDGRFFIGVVTTGIYCRPICPVMPPHEENVRYFGSAIAAAAAGFRPCLRCRPDSAPRSPAWRGTHTTLSRALALIDAGSLQRGSVAALCQRLGIGERYLRQLFQRHLGVSPKTYALYRQCLFAKQLLHDTALPITDIAYASGFGSLRRFNDAFQRQLHLSPSAVRRRRGDPQAPLTLTLTYRPPYAWSRLRHFHALHQLTGLEWIDDERFGRTFRLGAVTGHFTARHLPERHAFAVSLALSDLAALDEVVRCLRRLLDLDADTQTIEGHLAAALPGLTPRPGLRLPGVWDLFEAGVRAVLGQQISIAAATRLLQQLIDQLGEQDDAGRRRFPTPAAIAASDLAFLKLPGARRETLKRFATAYRDGELGDDPASWQRLKGIGPWTAKVAAFRGLSDPDVWLDGDVGLRRALAHQPQPLDPARAAPWRSYLTLQLWDTVI